LPLPAQLRDSTSSQLWLLCVEFFSENAKT